MSSGRTFFCLRVEQGRQKADQVAAIHHAAEQAAKAAVAQYAAQIAAASPVTAPPTAVKSIPWSELVATGVEIGAGAFSVVREYKWVPRALKVVAKELKPEIARTMVRGPSLMGEVCVRYFIPAC